METFALAAAALAATSAFIVGVRKIVAEFAAAARRQYKIDQLLHRELSDDGIRITTGITPSGTFTDRAVAGGTSYEYRIRAYGDSGTSVYGAWT